MSAGAARPVRMAWPQVSARRLERSLLTAPATAGTAPEDVVSALCGAHAQVLSAAELSVALRIDGATRSTVQDALWERRSLVKTYGPRGTVHLLPTAELPSWTAALGSMPASPSPFSADVRMTADQTEEVVAAVGKVLMDAELTIDELSEAVVAATGPWAGDLVMPAFQGMWPRWRQAITLSSHRGMLCFAPNRGRKVTYTNPHRYLRGEAAPTGRDAQADLLRRYLAGYGPSTPQQFAQWLNAPRSWATELFRSAGDALEEVRLEDAPAWVLAGDTALPAQPPSGVRLLPYFDSYVVASRPRDLLFTGRAATRALTPSGQAGNYPVLLVDGQAAGVWHQRRSGRRVQLTVEPLTALSKAQRAALDEQAERVGAALEGRVELTIGEVTVGAHA